MNRSVVLLFFLLFFLCGAATPLRAEDVGALIRQDETGFLQDQLKKLRGDIDKKDLQVQVLAVDKQALQKDLLAVREERDLLQAKVEGLQRIIWDQEKNFPLRIKKMTDPFQEMIDELLREQKILRMSVDEKNRRVNEVSGEGIQLRADVDNASREKKILMEEAQSLREELALLKAEKEGRIAQEKAPLEEKIRGLEARLTAEKETAAERLRQVQKIWEDKVLSLSRQMQDQDAAWRRKVAETRSALEAKIQAQRGCREDLKTGRPDKTVGVKEQGSSK